MIPSFHPTTGNLPSGIHEATWTQLLERFGWNEYRLSLIEGLRMLLENLQSVGCRYVYVDGSFVTRKEFPEDFDACWETAGVFFEDLMLLYPELLDFSNKRAAQKAKYRGEIFPADALADVFMRRFIDFFQIDPISRSQKGIVRIDLETL